MNQQTLSSLIWSVADLLRGDFKQSEYGRVILPFTVLRRLDCVLAPTKAEVLKEYAAKQAAGIAFEPFVKRKAGLDFYNVSSLDMSKLMGDQDNVRANLDSYIQGFAPDVRSIFEHFDFAATVERLHKAKLLYLVTEKFAGFNLHPSSVDNMQMGLVFEELIRKFAEISNETAGEHFTPREVIRLMVNLLFIEDSDALTKPGVVRTMYDPTAGTGGMLSVAGEYLAELNPKARLTLFGQELNPESHAICKADMLIRGQDISNIVLGNTLSDDGLLGKLFDYMLSNPPFGVEWKKIEKAIRDEHEKQGFNGRFGPGLPRVSDGSLLFLLHLLSKMRPAVQGGSRVGIVLNGSPLFTGGAGSGESEIRRYVLENDLVEAIVALPTDMFYNTGKVVAERLRKALDSQGTLAVLRQGFEMVGLKHAVAMCQFKPALAMNADLQARYAANRLRVVRQVHYSVHHENSIDLVLFVNGIPVATAELKSHYTQGVQDAVYQYKTDREPFFKPKNVAEPLLAFPGGALVHFAVSNAAAEMTTRLAGLDTTFLPFNQGNAGGAGNPPNPAGIATDYGRVAVSDMAKNAGERVPGVLKLWDVA